MYNLLDWFKDNSGAILAIVLGGLILWFLKKLLVLPGRVDKLDTRVDNLENKVEEIRVEQKEQGGLLIAIKDALTSMKIKKEIHYERRRT